MSRFDEGDADTSTAPDQPFIELHPLGRVENCYRWAGETDVFEAIDAVCRRYRVDLGRIAAGPVELVVHEAAPGTVIDVAAAEHLDAAVEAAGKALGDDSVEGHGVAVVDVPLGEDAGADGFAHGRDLDFDEGHGGEGIGWMLG